MKIKISTMGLAFGVMLLSPVSKGANSLPSVKFDMDSVTAMIFGSTLDIEALTSQVLAENSDNMMHALMLLLQLKPESARQILVQAMSEYPELAVEFANLAKTLGVSNEVITIAAIEAGIDPTQIAEQSAAGGNVFPAPSPSSPNSKSSVSRS